MTVDGLSATHSNSNLASCFTQSPSTVIRQPSTPSQQQALYPPKPRFHPNMFPEYPVDSFGNGHVGLHLPVDPVDAVAAIVSFSHHIEFKFCGLNRISFSDHISECTVAAIE